MTEFEFSSQTILPASDFALECVCSRLECKQTKCAQIVWNDWANVWNILFGFNLKLSRERENSRKIRGMRDCFTVGSAFGVQADQFS